VRRSFAAEPLWQPCTPSGSSDLVGAPDYVDYVEAWCLWSFGERDGRLHLCNVLSGEIWKTTEPLVGVLEAYRVEELDHRLELLGRRARPDAFGIVGLWGSVVEHEHGWRASRAYPRKICIPLEHSPSPEELTRLTSGIGRYRARLDLLVGFPFASVVDYCSTVARRA
jgi:hypothetical protein